MYFVVSYYLGRSIHLFLVWAFFACSKVTFTFIFTFTFTFTFTSPSLTEHVLQKYTFRIATAQRAGYGLDGTWIDYVYGGEFPHPGSISLVYNWNRVVPGGKAVRVWN